MKIKKLNNGIELLCVAGMSAADAMPTLGRVTLRAPLAAEGIAPIDDAIVEKLRERGQVSQWSFVPAQTKSDNFNFEKIEDVLPQDSDFITVKFRALSKSVVPGHWLDWTRDNVLEESTALLQGATVYPNHDFSDINNALGSVSRVAWDADGVAAADGTPGINAEYKIDALMNPRIARLLLMQPPAIHSTSMTVLFEFEYSHPDIAIESKWKFFEMLGEEVDGDIVRLIVTRIIEYWEASLVFQGADRLAKKYEHEDEDLAEMAAKTEAAEVEPKAAHSNEETTTMKLIDDQKKSLGIECEGEDVPETDVLNAALALADKVKGLPADIEDLKTQAAAGATLVAEKRAEVTAAAKLAELGAEDGTLDEVVVDQINNADADGLIKLGKYFDKKVAERFPNGRSSQEDSAAVDALTSNAETAELGADDPTGGLFGS